MNDKIKEILEYVLSLTYGNENAIKGTNKVLDYITNLQEENEKLKELCDKYEEEHNTAFKLWTMKMEEIPTYEEKKELQDRIDEAIKYIKDCGYNRWCYGEAEEDLLNILQGSDE